MFDTVGGLPVHVLVVHAVVVGVPVMSLATIAVAAQARWRGRPAWAVAVLNTGLLGLTLVAKEAGQELERRVAALAGGAPSADVAAHTQLGDQMPWYVMGLLGVSLLVPVLRHRRPLATVVLVLAVVAGLANIYWVYRVGDSGSRAVWGPIVENTQP